MAICLNCIQAPNSSPLPCEGLQAIVQTSEVPSPILYVIETVPNINSSIGVDYTFKLGPDTYTIVYTGSQWVLLGPLGNILYSNGSTGTENNMCPPNFGWVYIQGNIIGFAVQKNDTPNGSDACLNQNITLDSNITGWTASKVIWSSFLGGSAKYDNNTLGYIKQTGILTLGDTYIISLNYYAAATFDVCSPDKYQNSTIKIYAGTTVYTHVIENTYYLQDYINSINIELTCEGNTDFTIEIIDTNSCYASASGFKGIYLDNICIQAKEDSTQSYTDIAEVPDTVNGQSYSFLLDSFQNCLATKGQTFYKKIVGAVKCDDRELQKLKLILELLSQKDKDRALDCIYDRSEIAGFTYPELVSGSLPNLTEGDTEIVITGDISAFETFIFYIEDIDFTTTIVDAVYDVGDDETTITIKDEIPENLVGGGYEIKFQSEYDNSYLATFIDFASRFCSDCIVTPTITTLPVTPSIEVGDLPLIGENNTMLITSEFNQQIFI